MAAAVNVSQIFAVEMRVDLGRGDVRMTQKLLNGYKVRASFQ